MGVYGDWLDSGDSLKWPLTAVSQPQRIAAWCFFALKVLDGQSSSLHLSPVLMSADSHISWILIRLSEHSRAEFDLLGTPGGSPTHRFPTFPHCYSGLGNRAAAARLYWPPIPAGSAHRTLLLLEPSFRAAKHNIPADAELPSGLCACVCAYVCVWGEENDIG